MAHVCIMLLTYNRYEYAELTLRSALENIKYEGPLSVHIADDGSPDGYVAELMEIAKGMGIEQVTSTNSNHRGYGANYNCATQVVHSFADVVLPLEDDWQLLRELDLDKYVPVLGQFGCIRMGYLGFTQALHGRFLNVAGATWILMWPNSYEPHVWAGHPRLETVAWERAVGPWPEVLEAGPTEFAVAHKEAARTGVVWPMSYIKPEGDLWAHIGTVHAPNSLLVVEPAVDGVVA